MRPIVRMAVIASFLSVGAMAVAQEGYPLKGSWSGDWGSSASQRNPLLIVMDFDGQIHGTINPGTDNIIIKNASLDPKAWTVHVEGEAKDKSGKTEKYVLDGKIENLAMYDRSIKGTWSTSGSNGDFKVSRSKGN